MDDSVGRDVRTHAGGHSHKRTMAAAAAIELVEAGR